MDEDFGFLEDYRHRVVDWRDTLLFPEDFAVEAVSAFNIGTWDCLGSTFSAQEQMTDMNAYMKNAWIFHKRNTGITALRSYVRLQWNIFNPIMNFYLSSSSRDSSEKIKKRQI
jgi:hypothetical protein